MVTTGARTAATTGATDAEDQRKRAVQPAMTRAIQALGRRVAVLLSTYDVSRDRLYGHIKKRKARIEFMDFCRYVRWLYPAEVRLHFVLDNFSAQKGQQVRDRGPQQQRRARIHAHFVNTANVA